MKNSFIILSILTLTIMASGCGALKKSAASTTPSSQTTTPTTPATVTDPSDAIIATLGDWQTLQTGGNIKLNAGSNLSSSIQMRMVKDQAIYISLRPVLGIEVGKLLITGDSLYAVDKVHKRYIADKVSILTAGIPVTVSDVQDMFLGRPFIIGKGTLNDSLKQEVTVQTVGNTIEISPNEHYKGHGYTFTFDKSNRITTLTIVPDNASTSAYQAKYSDVHATDAGNIAHAINVNAEIQKKKAAFSLTYKDIEWNGKVNIDRSIPNGYQRVSASTLFSLFSN